MNWCILIPLLVGLISAILGYLLGKLLGSGNSNQTNVNLDVYKNRISKLESDLAACKANKPKKGLSSGAGNAGADSSLMASNFATASTIAFDAAEAKAAFGKSVKKDDLKIVEGIGPKIAELFHNHDVKTWYALSQCSEEKCKEVLLSGGKRFEIHKPGTWPKQAKLAYEGKWQKLKEWQDALDGGK